MDTTGASIGFVLSSAAAAGALNPSKTIAARAARAAAGIIAEGR